MAVKLWKSAGASETHVQGETHEEMDRFDRQTCEPSTTPWDRLAGVMLSSHVCGPRYRDDTPREADAVASAAVRLRPLARICGPWAQSDATKFFRLPVSIREWEHAKRASPVPEWLTESYRPRRRGLYHDDFDAVAFGPFRVRSFGEFLKLIESSTYATFTATSTRPWAWSGTEGVIGVRGTRSEPVGIGAANARTIVRGRTSSGCVSWIFVQPSSNFLQSGAP